MVLSKINALIKKLEKIVLIYSMIFLAFITVGNVISRTFFAASWYWAEEVSEFLLVIITFIGLSYAARRARHIRMSAVYDLTSEKIKKRLMIIISFITAASMFYLAYHSFRFLLNMMARGGVTPALNVPRYIIVICVPIGFLLAGIQYSLTFLKNVKEDDVWISSEVKSEYKSFEVDVDTNQEQGQNLA